MLVVMSIPIALRVFGLWLSVVSLVSIMPSVLSISKHILTNTPSDITIARMRKLCSRQSLAKLLLLDFTTDFP